MDVHWFTFDLQKHFRTQIQVKYNKNGHNNGGV